AGHIDEADSEWTSRRRGCLEEREAEINGDTAPLLFRQAIRIDTSKSTNQCSLAVIDMTRGADNHGLDRLRHAKGCITGGRPRTPTRSAAAARRALGRILVQPCADRARPGLRGCGRPP